MAELIKRDGHVTDEIVAVLKVVDELQTNLDACYSPDDQEIPHARADVSVFTAAVLINDILLWENQDSGDENLTVDYCWAKYHQTLEYLNRPFQLARKREE